MGWKHPPVREALTGEEESTVEGCHVDALEEETLPRREGRTASFSFVTPFGA